jgi:hypothetical protein
MLSVGGFLTVHVMLWDGIQYVDLARDIERDKPCGAYSFADFDNDGLKELVITHCRAAIDPTTEIYRLNERLKVYERVEEDDPFFMRCLEIASQIKDDKPFWGEEGDDTPWKNPNIFTPESRKLWEDVNRSDVESSGARPQKKP